MRNEIISRWIVKYKDWNIAITSKKEVYDINTLTLMEECWNNGTISYRIPRSNRKIGVKTINKHCIKMRVVLQEKIPF